MNIMKHTTIYRITANQYKFNGVVESFHDEECDDTEYALSLYDRLYDKYAKRQDVIVHKTMFTRTIKVG